MRTFLGIALCFCVVNLPFVRGECLWVVEKVYILDTDVNKKIFNYTSTDKFEFTSWSVTEAQGGLTTENALTYFNHNTIDNTFYVQTTDNFGNVNRDAYSDGAEQIRISLSVTVNCNGQKETPNLLVFINNTNQNAPEFSQPSYAYSLPMPIMPKTDFSLYGTELITASDIDFSTSNIVFSIAPEDFTVTSLKIGNKKFQAIFSANKILRLNEPKIYSLTATDSGSPAKSTSVTVTLNVDPTTGLDSPSFSRAYYSYNYTVGGTDLIPTSGDIVIQSDKPDESIYNLIGELSDIFTLKFTSTSKTFEISIKPDSTLAEHVSSPIVLTLSYTTDITVNAIILITVINDKSIPKFSSDYYTGTYDIVKDKITWNEPIKVSDATTVIATGDKSSLFTVNSKTSELTPTNPLSKADFDDNSNLLLTLIASSSTGESRATVVISLPSSEELKFDSIYYTGVYSIQDEKGVVTLNSEIKFSDSIDFTGITIDVDESYISYFKIELDSSTWKVTVLQDLSDTTINANTEIAFPITATKTSDSEKSTAILILKLPGNIGIQFTNPYYTAHYVSGSGADLDTITLDNDIIIEGADASDLTVTSNEYSSNFKIELESSKWKITVLQDLSSTTLKANTELAIIITATKISDSEKSRAILILKLPGNVGIQFTNPYYTAHYVRGSGADLDSITLDNDIIIEGADASDITVTPNEYSSNFKIETKSSKWKITILQALNSTIFNANTELAIPITATKISDSEKSTAVLILKLPGNVGIQFTSPYYTAHYVSGSGADLATITLDNDINIEGANTSVTVTLDAYSSYFKIELDSSTWKIAVLQDLSDTIMKANTELAIPITATKTSDSEKSTAILILILPGNVGIQFTNPYYTAHYISGSGADLATITVDNDIIIEGADTSDITVTPNEYSSNFKIELESSKWKITVLQDLSSTTLKANTELAIIITATKISDSEKSRAILILKLLGNVGIQFTNPYYTAHYIRGSGADLDSITLDNDIIIEGADASDITVTPNEYSSNFKIETKSSKWKITILQALNSTIFNANAELAIPITATKISDSEKSTAVLILKLPGNVGIQFTSPYYTAHYVSGSGADLATITLDNDINIEGANTSVTVTLDAYSSYFKIELDSSTWKIAVLQDLSDTIMKANTELAIPITATKTSDSEKSTAILILKLPGNVGIQFTNPYYTAHYVSGSGADLATITLDNDIIIEGADTSDITVTPNEYSGNFKIELESSKWKITVLQDLSSTTLKANTELAIIITATKITDSEKSRAILILKLPGNVGIQFTNPYYTAHYVRGSGADLDSITLDNDIIIEGADANDITVTPNEYTSNFKIETESSKWKITVLQALNSTIFNANAELAIPITATKISDSEKSTAVLILKLPGNVGIQFTSPYYTAHYVSGSGADLATITLDNDINIEGANTSVTVTLDAYSSYFKIELDSSTWKVTVLQDLSDTTLNANTEIAIPITAKKTSDSEKSTAILILKLPGNVRIQFTSPYYTAHYVSGSGADLATITLDNDIIIEGADTSNIKVTVNEYSSNFKIELESSKWKITVLQDLSNTTLKDNNEIAIPITATMTSVSAKSTAILVLKLPGNVEIIQFTSIYYTANYIKESGTDMATVTLDNEITIEGADISDITINLDAYSSNFKIELESSKWKITVLRDLSDMILNANSELAFPIIATKTSNSAKSTAILILKLPGKVEVIQFSSTSYTANYLKGSGTDLATITLDKDIFVDGADSSDITITFDAYSSNFEIKLDQNKWKILVLQNLNSTVLNSNIELAVPITATKTSDSAKSRAILILKLPKKVEIKFTSSYYTANYARGTEDNMDTITFDEDITIEGDASDINISLDGYEANFEGTCDSSSLKCAITVKENLNASIMSTYSELFITLTASNEDGSSKEKTVLFVTLPLKTSSFAFKKQHYSAVYTIQKSNNDIATIQLNDVISFDGAELSELTIILDEYSQNFNFEFDSKWILIVTKNLESEILSNHSELFISLTAQKAGTTDDYSKATLVIKLPDKTTMAFLAPQYSAEYVVDGNGIASVALTENSEIKTTDPDVQITLESYLNNFEVVLDTNSKWTINVKSALDKTVFTINKQLNLLMTITKVGVKYGGAVLVMKLPDPSFSKGFYIATYTEDASGSIELEDDIEVLNADPAEIQVNLSEYSDYIYTDLQEDKWTLKLSKPLPANVTQHYEILMITLEAIRKNDNAELTTSTLVVKLPDVNETKTPRFKQFTFYGDYKNSSDTSSVNLTEFIGFTNSDTVKIANISIDEEGSRYSANFKLLLRQDGTYEVEVTKDLSEDVLSTETSIVLTLVASTEEGKHGYAILVITLPKTTRETSVQFEDEKILYNGTYENGTFKSPSITLKTNSTDDSQISVEITNDLGLQNSYFKPKYSNKVLTIDVEDLPKDVLKNYPVIPLKLAITDKESGDTVQAVLNVKINYKSNDDDGGKDDTGSARTALLIAVIILACLLVGLIAAGFFFWYFKIRNSKYEKMDEEVEQRTTKPNGFTKNLTRQTSTPPSISSLRRPTGLPVGFVRPESPTEDVSSDFEVSTSLPETEKKVAFNNIVQNIDEFAIDNEEFPENLRNVADRRPTQFIFGHPTEEEDLDSPTERRESSDYIGTDSDKKKSVVFDENVERMHIDVVDDEDNDSAEDEDTEDRLSKEVTSGDGPTDYKSQIEIKVEDSLPTEIKETL